MIKLYLVCNLCVDKLRISLIRAFLEHREEKSVLLSVDLSREEAGEDYLSSFLIFLLLLF